MGLFRYGRVIEKQTASIENSKKRNDMEKLKICLLLAVLLWALPAVADESTLTDTAIITEDSATVKKEVPKGLSRTLFLELGGPSFGVGLGYDSRFRPGSVFGYRTGLSYTNGSNQTVFGDYWLYYKGVSIPLEVNAIMGKRKSKFEVGIGMIPSILKMEEHGWIYTTPTDESGDFSSYYFKYYEKKGTRVNIMGMFNIGYRYQRRHGFFMRVGLTYIIGDYKCSPIDGAIILPYIAFGYTI